MACHVMAGGKGSVSGTPRDGLKPEDIIGHRNSIRLRTHVVSSTALPMEYLVAKAHATSLDLLEQNILLPCGQVVNPPNLKSTSNNETSIKVLFPDQ